MKHSTAIATSSAATGENIAAASPASLQELVGLVVARVVAINRQVVLPPEWTPPAAPFFEQPEASFWRPRRALEPLYRRDGALAWYVA